MSLDKFTDKKETLLVIDFYNLIYRTLYTAHKEDPLDKKFNTWKYILTERIINDIDYFNANRCILAIDDRNYWRREIYPDYKNKRKSTRQKSVIDFDAFWPVMESFLEELKKAFPNIFFLKVKKCEADDIIAVLIKERWSNYKVICISNDSDLVQLKKYRNYNQYNPMKLKFYNPINSQKDLLIKILTGDSSDDIPNVKFRCGEVTARKMIDEGLEQIFEKDEDIKKNFIRNKQLIDLDMIPINYQKKIIDVYDNCNINKYNGRHMFNFLTDNNLRGILENFEKYSKKIMNLC